MTPDPDPNATLATIVETRTPKGPLKGEFYLRCCGALYKSGRDVADVAKLVRADLARLAKGGVLPDGFKASVRISRYSMGCSLAIAIASAGAAQVIDAEKWIEMEAGNWNGSWDGRRYSAEGKRLLEVAEHIGRQYQRQESDSHTDYHNTNFHLQVDFESALCHAQLEAAKAGADAAAKAGAASAPHSPLAERYGAMVAALPARTLLFLRLGDFYEAFGDAAKTAAPILGVALTKRRDIPMCGFPYHAKDRSIKSLTAAGYRVALSENQDAPLAFQDPEPPVERPAGVIAFPSRVIPVPAEEAEGDGSPSEMFLYLPTHPGEHGARHVGEDNFGTPIYERPDSTRFTVTYTPKGKVLIFPC